MADDNPLTVYTAENAKIAEVAVKILEAEGIVAEAIMPPLRTESEAITGMTELTTPDEIEIRVTDFAKVEEAKKILASAASFATFVSVRQKRLARTGTVTAVCEECGESSEWPASVMGTTENCPHCGAFMDVPDPDENWDDVDFGTEDGEDEPQEDTK